MGTLKRLSMKALGGSDVLAGSGNGKAALGKMIAALPRSASPILVVVDFDDVSVATGSFLREAVVAFRDYCRTNQPSLYPVVANASDETREDLDLLLKDRGEVCVVCQVDPRDRISHPQIVGALEEKQIVTLNAVAERGSADANELHRSAKASEGISITGWNNRLASLVLKGVLMEFKQGKSKTYKPVLEGLRYGN